MCLCYVNIGCDFCTIQVSAQLGSMGDRSRDGEIHSGLMIQKRAFSEDVCGSACVSMCVHLGICSSM